MAAKKTTAKETKKNTSVTMSEDPENKGWAIFQEGNKVYVFHFCGKDPKSEWFKKTENWGNKPVCEACKLHVPEKMAALVKIQMSGL